MPPWPTVPTSRRTQLRAHAWWLFLAAGLVLMAAYAVAPSGLVQDVIYFVIGLGSVLAIRAGVRLHGPQAPRPWLLMAGGLLLWVAGDLLYSVHDDVLHSSSYPALGDYFYLAAYPVLAFGLFQLARSRRPEGDQAGTLDGWAVAAGLALVSVEVLVRPSFAGGGDLLPRVISVAYPLGDILLVAGLVRLVTTPGAWNRATKLLVGAVAFLLAADTGSTLLGLYSSADTTWLDFLWLASYLAWGASSLHRSMTRCSEPVTQVGTAFSRRRLVAAGLATMIAPGTLAVQSLLDLGVDVWGVVVGSVVLFSLVVARMAVAIEQIAEVDKQRAELQDQLAFEASHDALTQLPNRAHGLTLTTAALDRARTHGTLTSLLFVDLDGFKLVNDTYGHRTGDQVLRLVAERLRGTVRAGDVAMRLGGDEFVVLLEDVVDADDAVAVAERLVVALAQPMQLAGGAARIGASIGVALCHAGSTDADTLLNEADVAAYRAKAAGKGRAELYDESMRDEAAERAQLESILRTAIDDDELVLHYQPIINTHSGDVEGYEALVRWNRPGEGLLSPAQFLPLAETTDLICDLDAWVLERATAQVRAWSVLFGTPDLFVSVNVSMRYAARPRIVRDVRRALSESGIAPAQLVLEMGEGVLHDQERSVQHLHELRELGVAVSIDDFGASFNALSRLAEMPVDVVKIDRRYLDVDSAMSGRLLHLMIQGAHAVGLSAVAQGVEQDVQLATLRSLDCESVQGFHIARPMPADAAEVYHRDRIVDRFSGLIPAAEELSDAEDRLG